jgi:hypothetical protein
MVCGEKYRGYITAGLARFNLVKPNNIFPGGVTT